MKFTYDHAADAAYIELTSQPTVNTKRVNAHMLLHFDEAGDVKGIELLNVRKQGIDPLTFTTEYFIYL